MRTVLFPSNKSHASVAYDKVAPCWALDACACYVNMKSAQQKRAIAHYWASLTPIFSPAESVGRRYTYEDFGKQSKRYLKKQDV